MAIIDGRKVRTTMTHLRINELSAVDRPAQEGAMATIMKRDDRSPDRGSFMARVAEIQKRDGCTGTEAMTRARIEYPDAFEAMQSAPVTAPVRQDHAPDAMVQKARSDFSGIVREIAKRDHVPEYVAMGKARAEYPAAFAAAYP